MAEMQAKSKEYEEMIKQLKFQLANEEKNHNAAKGTQPARISAR